MCSFLFFLIMVYFWSLCNLKVEITKKTLIKWYTFQLLSWYTLRLLSTDKQVINYMNNHFWKKQKEDYQEGNRQSSLLRKAAQLCKYGVLYENALKELKFRYCYAGLSEEEVESKVAYCYSSNVFGCNRSEIQGMREDSRKRKEAFSGVPVSVPLR